MKNLTLTVLLILSCATAWSADFDKGASAYQSGNYKGALAQWRPLAQSGSARAQNFLGFMYDNGEGVLEDDIEAVKWYRLAAEQGSAKAQYGLGVMFANGEGVAQSNVYAHMWWNISAADGDRQAKENKAIIASQMTAQELANAKTLARACVSKRYKNCYKRRSSIRTK